MSKADVCKAIYAELEAQHTKDGVTDFKALRAAAIARFVSEAGCTTAGAATYYANCKNRDGATGSYIRKGEGHARYTSNVPESNEPDERPLYSAVQLDRNKKVGAVAAFFNPEDALKRAKIVRGITVHGAPEIGEIVDPTSVFDETILQQTEEQADAVS